MIIDKLENASKYYNLGKNFEDGLKFLQNTNLEDIECQKHIIDGERIWANVQEMETKDPVSTPWEVHKRYTDIQYVIKGEERMDWANLEDFIPNDNFDEANDIQFGTIQEKSYGMLTIPAGYFVIFTPQDIHKPALFLKTPQTIKKIVVKIETN